MTKRFLVCILLSLFLFVSTPFAFAEDVSEVGMTVEIAGVKFPTGKVIDGKQLKLNGVSILKKYGFIQVYAAGLYLEEMTQDPEKIIYSEQVKYLHTQYLTNKATAQKIRNGFIELMEESNSEELIGANKDDINKFASWLDADMGPGLSSETVYIPGDGLTLIYQGEVKGTIPGKTFAQMYYNYQVGEKADDVIRQGLLGLEDKD